MNSQPDLHGIIVATATPFTEDGSAIDEANLAGQTDRLITAGIHGLLTAASTGEFTTMSLEEHKRVIELTVMAAAGRVPVVAGVGALATPRVVELAQHSERVGAAAVMVIPPFWDPISLDAVKVLLQDVSDAVTIPIMYYHIPGSTGVALTTAEIAGLSETGRVRYVKDTSGDAVSYECLAMSCSNRITVFCGTDTLAFTAIAGGAQGVLSGVGGLVPELTVELWETLAIQGDLAKARALWKKLWPIGDFLQSVCYTSAVKTGLDIVGHPAGPPRAPILPLNHSDRDRLIQVLRGAGVTTVA